MTNYLPPNPSLKQLKMQAKDLLNAHRAGDADACVRIKAQLPRLAQATEDEVRNARVALREAQLVLAREYGFPSWPRLQHHLDSGISRAYRTEHDRRLYRAFQGTDISGMEWYAQERLDAHRAGLVSAVGFAANLKQYVPRLVDMSAAQILATEITQDEVRAVLARQRGFKSWEDLVEYDRGKAHQEPLVDAEFQAAIDAVEARDVETLRGALGRAPDLAHAVSPQGTLLEIAARTKSEDKTAIDVAQLLIDAGAAAEQVVVIAAECGNIGILKALLEAEPLNPAAEERALNGCVVHGEEETLALLLQHGLVPRSFWLAAAAGRLDLVKEWFSADGRLKLSAGANRPPRVFAGPDFYRPKTDDPQEIISEAFFLACWLGHREVVEFLLDKGAEVNARPCNNYAALHAAANKNRRDMVDFLLANGAVAAFWERHTLEPWGMAEWGGHRELAAYLKDRAERTHILVAAAHGRADCVQVLLQEDISAETLQEALGEAVLHNHADVCDLLVAAGAELA